MGNGTVSNHQEIIATKGTPHIAKAVPSTADLCFDIMRLPTVNGDNQIESLHLSTGKPTKTVIENQPAWTAVGWLDAAPSHPAHAGVNGWVNKNAGAKGLNYIQYAYPVTYSLDVKIEGAGVVRTNDQTKQNGGNCDGIVDGSQLQQWTEQATKIDPKKCTIKKVTGECGHGRKIGAPPNADKGGDGFYLDVLGGDTVTLEAERKDVSQPGKETDPTCGKHTSWKASRTGIDGATPKKEDVGDKFVIDGDVMKDPMPELATLPFDASSGTDARTKRRQDAVQTALARGQTERLMERGQKGNVVNLPGSSKAADDAAAAKAAKNPKPPAPLNRDSAAQRQEKEWAGRVKTAKTATEVAKLLAQLWMHWQFENKPPVVNVTATACSGAKNIKLRVFPAEPVQYSLPLEWLQKIMDKLHSIGKVTNFVRDKLRVTVKFEFLQGFSVEFQLAFKELTADKNGRFKTEVRRAWYLGLKIEKVIYLDCEGNLSVLQLIGNAIFPGMGAILDRAAAFAGFTLVGFISFELTMSLQIAGGVDEYLDGSINGSEAALVGTFKLGARAEYDGKFGHVKAWANTLWENTLKATNFRRPDTPEAWALFDVVGYIQLGAQAGYVVDLFNWNSWSRATIGISRSDSKTWKPEWLKFPGGKAVLGTFKLAPAKA